MKPAHFIVGDGDTIACDPGRPLRAVILDETSGGTGTVAVRSSIGEWELRHGCPLHRGGEEPAGSYAVEAAS